MTAALALRQLPALYAPIARRRGVLLVYRISTFLPRRERLLFALLHIVRRMMVQQGHDPTTIEGRLAVDRYDQPGALVMWWRSCAREYLSTLPRRANHPADHPWPPTLVLAEDPELEIVVVHLAPYVDVQTPTYAWYCDGWCESVAWALAGCPHDERDRHAAKVRADNANADRLAALDAEGRADAMPIVVPAPEPKLRVVQDAGPLFSADLPPVSMDMEAELEGDDDDFVF